MNGRVLLNRNKCVSWNTSRYNTGFNIFTISIDNFPDEIERSFKIVTDDTKIYNTTDKNDKLSR